MPVHDMVLKNQKIKNKSMLQPKINFKASLYIKLLGFLTKKGNKLKAKKIINAIFLNLSNRTGHSFSFLLMKLFLKLNTFVEAKTIQNRRRSYQIPFSINLNRRAYLTIKWLMKIAFENKKKYR